MQKFKLKSNVIWKWLGREIHGRVLAVYTQRVSKTIKGKQITRNGSKENPAYLVISDAGNQALKLQTELHAPSRIKSKRPTPRMFAD